MRYFIGFMITIGLFILLIFLLFSGGGKPKVPTTSKTLESYASTAAEVSMVVDAPINANSQHQQIHITADRNNVTYEEVAGYDGRVVRQERFANTENAYAVFLRSLANAGFTKGDIKKELSDERGYCPLGTRYIFELRDGSRSIQRFWWTSCGKPKTYLGNPSLTIQLFEDQVPNYPDLSQDVKL
jgi:hypothetical protein